MTGPTLSFHPVHALYLKLGPKGRSAVVGRLRHDDAITDPAHPLHSLHLKLGHTWLRAMEKLIDIEDQFEKLEGERTFQNTLAYADGSLGVVVEAVRHSLRWLADDPARAEAHDKIERVLFHANAPTPLFLIAMELREVWHGRNSPLFSRGRAGVRSFNFLRRQIQAFTAASIMVLNEYKMSQVQAAELLAEVLEKRNFPSTNKGAYDSDTLLTWMRHRKMRTRAPGESTVSDFESNVRRYRFYLRGIAGPIARRGDLREARQAILTRFGTFVDSMIIYPDKK